MSGYRVSIDSLLFSKKPGSLPRVTGYPLPTLLRLALLANAVDPKSIDVVMSYSHLNLQNDSFKDFVPHFHNEAEIPQLVTASPLNMGLLTPAPPVWHPAPPELRAAVAGATREAEKAGWEGGIVNLALGFAYREATELQLPNVVGLSKPAEVHETIRIWRETRTATDDLTRKNAEKRFQEHLGGLKNYSWSSP